MDARDKESQNIMINVPIHQKDTTVIHIYRKFI